MSNGDGPGLTNRQLGAELALLQRLALEPMGTIKESSLGYFLQAIYQHLHAAEQWYGRDAGDNLLNRESLLPWVVSTGAGAEAYGAEVQISDGTEVEGGSATKEMDIHRMIMTAVSQQDNAYKVQVWAGTGLFAAATLISEIVMGAGGVMGDMSPRDLHTVRVPCNRKLWLRAKSASAGPDTISLLIGLHTYGG